MWLDPNRTHLDYRIKITGLDFGLVARGVPTTPAELDDVYGTHIHWGLREPQVQLRWELPIQIRI
jgi:hypothetical protein